MAITHPPGFPVATNGDTTATPAPTTVTFPHAYGAVGDLAIVGVITTNAIPVSSITGTNTGTWTRRPRYQDATNNQCVDIWTAPVTSTSGADVITPTYGGTTTGQYGDFFPDSLTAGFGSNTVWSFPTANTTTGATSATISYPNLTSATTVNAQAYWGVGISASLAGGGTTTGFSYIDSPGASGNEQVYNLSLSSGTAYAPTSTQNVTSFYDTAAVIVEAANSGGVTAAGRMFFSAIAGSTSFPPPEVTSLSVTSGPTGGGTGTTLTGVYFPGATSVKFGSTSTTFTYISPTSITTVSPPGTAGATVNVSVTGPAGTSTNAAGNMFTYAGSGGNPIPTVPAGTLIPTNIILNENFDSEYNASKPYNGLNLNVWATSMWGDGYAQTGGDSPPSSSANVTLQSDGLHLTATSSLQGIVMAHGTPDPATTGTYTGLVFGPPSANSSVFMEAYGKFNISSGITSSAWCVAPSGLPGYSSWPYVGEIDIIETNMTGSADICFIWQNSNGSINNGPNGPETPNQPTAMSSDQFCTVGMLWTTGGVFFYWGGQPTTPGGGTNGNNPPGYTMPAMMTPVLQCAPNGGGARTGVFIVQYCRVWQGPLSAHP